MKFVHKNNKLKTNIVDIKGFKYSIATNSMFLYTSTSSDESHF